MAGEKTTGMDQAQNVDQAAVRQGKGRAALTFVKRYTPGTDAYKARKNAQEAAQAQTAENLKSVNIDAEKISGDNTTAFNNHFVAAIRTGHDDFSSGEERSPANLIREIITRREFIVAIRDGALSSPHEEVDEEYKRAMQEKRNSLANELLRAAENPRHLMGELDTSDLDILYSAFLGTAPYQTTQNAVSFWSREDAEGNLKYPNWPDMLPMPPKAFFIFMESVARLQAKTMGSEVEREQGLFVGDVCRYLAWRGMKGFTSRPNPVLRQLVDQNELERYINGHASEPIETAVSNFIEAVKKLLDMPTARMDPELGVPGLGYADRYQTERNRLAQEIADAEGTVAKFRIKMAEATGKEEHATERKNAAQTADQQLLTALQIAGKEGKAAIGGVEYTLEQITALKTEANEVRNRAAKEAADAGMARHEAEVMARRAGKALEQKNKDADAHAESANPEALAQILGSEFRAFLENRGGTIESLEKAAEAVDRMPNRAVTDIVDEGAKLLEKKGALQTRFDKTPLDDGEREQLSDLIISLNMVPGLFDTEKFGEKEIAVLQAAAGRIGMLPARYDKGQLGEEDSREFASLAIALQRLPARFGWEQEIRAERLKLEQTALQAPGKNQLEPAKGYSGLEMALKKVEMARDEEGQIAVANRQDLERTISSATGRLRTVLDHDRAVNDEERTYGYVKRELAKELGEFRQKIDDAQLPAEVKERMLNVHRLLDRKEPLSDKEREMVNAALEGMRTDYGHPLRKAADRSIMKLKTVGYGQHAGLSNIAWVNAKIKFQEHTGSVKEKPPEEIKGWAKWKAIIARTAMNLVNPFWWGAGAVALFDRFIKDDLVLMFGRNRWHREIEIVKNRDGSERVNKKWWNFVRGFADLAFKFYLTTAIVGYMMARPPTSGLNWINPVHLAGRITLTPLTQWARGVDGEEQPRVKRGRPLVVKLATPWTWTWDYVDQKPQMFLINDHPSNPKTLGNREPAYYVENYGVGTQSVEGGSTTKAQRLAWIKKHPDVLRFFQERIDGYRVLRNHTLQQNPDTCINLPRRGKKKKGVQPLPEQLKPDQKIRLPRSCTAKPFNLKTRGQVLEWKYGKRTDGWELSQHRLCCLLKLDTSTEGMLDRGLKVNPARADAVVDWLMATEKGGQKITYAFLTSPENMRRWKDMWFLVSAGERKIVGDHALSVQENVRFLLSQGANATSMFYPVCAKKALAPSFLLKDKRDGFVKAWVAEITKLKPELKPMDQEVPNSDLKTAFDNASKANPKWFTDRTQDYKRQKVVDALPGLKLETDEAKDALAEEKNDDVLELVKKYEKSPYVIDPDRSDDFVLLLDAEKRRLGAAALKAYDPHTPSFKLQQAVKMGYIKGRAGGSKESSGSTLSTGQTTLPKSAVYSQDVAGFYKENTDFSKFVDEAIAGMFKSRVQGRIMESVLKDAFQGDRAAMDSAIKAHIFNILDKKQANIHMVKVGDEEGKKTALFPPQGHRERGRALNEVSAKIQQLLAPMFKKPVSR